VGCNIRALLTNANTLTTTRELFECKLPLFTAQVCHKDSNNSASSNGSYVK